MTETLFECVNEWGDAIAPARKASIQKGKGLGVEFITLSPDVAAWYIKTAYDEKWKDLEKRIPDYVPELKKMLTK
jgi:hypothetical protein